MGSQEVSNQAPIDKQVNIADFEGNIHFFKKSRLATRFEKLKEEVSNGVKYGKFIDDFETYNTELDGRSMPEKLKDGGFSEKEIFRATRRKLAYSKKLEMNKFYETAQRIDLDLFALINFNFETYIEPLIECNTEKQIILQTLNEKVVTPILQTLNEEGQEDTFLNYTVDDILGMVYFLTGKCHINWANYDSI